MRGKHNYFSTTTGPEDLSEHEGVCDQPICRRDGRLQAVTRGKKKKPHK
jgi:hypothetical protein